MTRRDRECEVNVTWLNFITLTWLKSTALNFTYTCVQLDCTMYCASFLDSRRWTLFYHKIDFCIWLYLHGRVWIFVSHIIMHEGNKYSIYAYIWNRWNGIIGFSSIDYSTNAGRYNYRSRTFSRTVFLSLFSGFSRKVRIYRIPV